MPGYANVALVADHIEQIHAYFKGRTEGRIGAGNLQPMQDRSPEAGTEQPED